MDKITMTMMLLEGKEEVVSYYREAIKACKKINTICKNYENLSKYELTDLKNLNEKVNQICNNIYNYKRILNAHDLLEFSFVKQFNRIESFRCAINSMIFQKTPKKEPGEKSKSAKKEKRRLLAKNRNSRCNGMRRH